MNGPLIVGAGTDDFLITFDPAVLSGTGGLARYSSVGDNVIRDPLVSAYTLSEVTDTAVVPLPGALPLFATGLGALGLLAWRRKKKAGAALAA